MAAGNNDDPVFSHGSSGSYLNIYRDALLADDPHKAYDRTHDRRNSIGITVGAIVGLALAGSIGWYVYSRLPSSAPADTEIPVLRAVPEVVKVRPDNPGGLDVPNRDKLIYQQMGEASVASGGEEHLLPPIETLAEPPGGEPVEGRGAGDMSSSVQTETPHQLDSDLSIPMATIGPPEGSFPKAVMSPVTPPVPPAPVIIAAPPVTPLAPPETAIRPEQPVSSLSELIARRVKLPPVHRTLEGKSSTVLPVIRPAAPATVLSSPSPTSPISREVVGVHKSTVPRGGTRLQLGSFQNTKDAEKAWLQLVSRHGDLLGGTVHTLVQVDLGLKGSWYRVYAGPYSDMRAALSVCYALKQRSVGCVFARK